MHLPRLSRCLSAVIFGVAAWWGSSFLFCETKQSRPIAPAVQPSATNSVLLLSSSDGVVEFVDLMELAKHPEMTNVINQLVTNGIICKVRGHRWVRDLNYTMVIYPEQDPADLPQVRKCAVCDRIQIREPGEWKDK